MSDILTKIVAHKAVRLAASKQQKSLADLRAEVLPSAEPHRFIAALQGEGINIIAEIKRRSPSKGIIRADFDPEAIAANYTANGAACISVLTEEDYFDGSLEYLAAVRVVTGLPLIRKDFIFDEYQIFEAAQVGADAILLIAAMLEPVQLNDLMQAAYGLGLDVLVEIHDREEAEKVLPFDVRLLGVNNRNLRSFETSLDTSIQLASELPKSLTLVSESGIRTRADIGLLRSAGFHAFLIGEEFMRAENEGAALKSLLSQA